MALSPLGPRNDDVGDFVRNCKSLPLRSSARLEANNQVLVRRSPEGSLDLQPPRLNARYPKGPGNRVDVHGNRGQIQGSQVSVDRVIKWAVKYSHASHASRTL